MSFVFFVFFFPHINQIILENLKVEGGGTGILAIEEVGIFSLRKATIKLNKIDQRIF